VWPALGIAVAIAVVLGVAAFVVLRRTGTHFPETLGGQPRNTSDPVHQLEDAVSQVRVGDMRMEVAVYGSDATSPAAMLIVIHDAPASLADTSSEEFFHGLPSDLVSNGTSSADFSRAETATADGVDYLCVPIQASTSTGFGPVRNATACAFRGDVLGLAMFAVGPPAPTIALTFTQQAYRELV